MQADGSRFRLASPVRVKPTVTVHKLTEEEKQAVSLAMSDSKEERST